MEKQTLHHAMISRFFSITQKDINETTGTWSCNLSYQGAEIAKFNSANTPALTYTDINNKDNALFVMESVQFKEAVLEQLTTQTPELQKETMSDDEAIQAVIEILFYQAYLREQQDRLGELCLSSFCVGNLNEFDAIGFNETFTDIIKEMGKEQATQFFQTEYDKIKPSLTETRYILNSEKQLKDLGIRA